MSLEINSLFERYPIFREQSELYYLAIYTDRVVCDRFIHGTTDLNADSCRLLELRVFCGAGESRWFRSDLSEEFTERTVIDNTLESGSYLDEIQYLDISGCEEKEGCCEFTTTGGGRYTLPVSSGIRRVRLRNYIHYSETSGLAHFCDWRIVGFEKGGSEYGV